MIEWDRVDRRRATVREMFRPLRDIVIHQAGMFAYVHPLPLQIVQNLAKIKFFQEAIFYP